MHTTNGVHLPRSWPPPQVPARTVFTGLLHFAFLQKYPNGALALAAQSRIDDYAKTKLIVQGGGADGRDAAISIQPYRAGQIFTTRSIFSKNGETSTLIQKWRVLGCTAEGCDVESVVPGNPYTKRRVLRASPSGATLSTTEEYVDESKKGLTNTFDPPGMSVPLGLLQVGQRWKIASKTNSATSHTVSGGYGRIISREPVTVEAGTFDTFRMESTVEMKVIVSTNGTASESNRTVKRTAWISPTVPQPVKQLLDLGDGMVTTIEMVNYNDH